MPDQTYLERKKKLITYFKKFKQLPSYDELAELFNLKSKGSLHRYMEKFIEEGIIKKDRVGKLLATESLYGLRVLGTVQAGFPTTAEENLNTTTMSLDQWLIRNPEATYLLTVSGDSMVDAGIMEGDMVIVDRSRLPKTGDIIIAEVDHEWTIKYYIKRGEKIFLRPANKNYPDIHPRSELKIAGTVASVVRKY
ncbi:MAG: transcriptional repressor LexA [Patescibacteria group bacterium]